MPSQFDAQHTCTICKCSQRQWIVKSHSIESGNKIAAAAIANFILWEIVIKCAHNSAKYLLKGKKNENIYMWEMRGICICRHESVFIHVFNLFRAAIGCLFSFA